MSEPPGTKELRNKGGRSRSLERVILRCTVHESCDCLVEVQAVVARLASHEDGIEEQGGRCHSLERDTTMYGACIV